MKRIRKFIFTEVHTGKIISDYTGIFVQFALRKTNRYGNTFTHITGNIEVHTEMREKFINDIKQQKILYSLLF